MSVKLAAWTFAGLIAIVAAFQLALALGAPLGHLAMGGAFPGTLPPLMRAAAIMQIIVVGVVALVILSRAGLVLPAWRAASRSLAWAIVALLAISALLNLITPSPMERMIWAPVAIVLFLTSLRVALSR